MHQEQLFKMIREKVKDMVAGYINTKELQDMDNYIVPASLHDDQGIMGAIKLGLNALEQGKSMINSNKEPISSLKGNRRKNLEKLFEKVRGHHH